MLYIVATPIGNLKDITFRAIEVFKSVDIVLCEDTRRTSKLFSHYDVKTPLLSYHSHSNDNKINKIIDLIKDGKNLALVTDAGTPGISDPGTFLIKKIIEECGDSISIVPIPGCCALAAAASVVDFSIDKFIFLGFPPALKKRNKFFEELKNFDYPIILYESPYRIIKTLKDIAKVDPSFYVVICRELTKQFETIYRGNVLEVIPKIEEKGEFIIIIKK
ncbi:MAG TPA: 16S rRNA (cytidine(1402)-2'-O)-methyltransferase [Candidatus Pacearchaeota archaeon]|nr:16S rRNA (cytidine(1402)-2'-O)-methyltransferase [Candidatus Pacearchaeota archaeon]